MTLQQLKYIVALDNYRNFVAAADSCFVTQPTMTMQVKKLEEEIGVTIFDRHSKPLAPTYLGEQIITKSRQILREVSQLKEFVIDETESLTGEFTLGIIPTLAPYLLPRFLPAFIEANPKTQLKIIELQTKEIISRLNNGTLDLGILVTPLDERHIREITLFNEPFLLYLPANHRLSSEKVLSPGLLQANEMLLLEEGHCFREQALAICGGTSNNNDKSFQYESGSIETLKGLVKQDMGYTLVPELSILDEIEAAHVKRFEQPEPVREVSLVVNNGFAKEALIESLHKAILPAMPSNFFISKKYTKVKWR